MGVMAGQFYKERYRIGGKPVDCVVDYDKETVTVQTYGFSKTYALAEYENCNGDMKAFAEAKLKEQR